MIRVQRFFKHSRFVSTHFGFKEVDLDEKQSKVDNVFTRVARKYDIMNDVMSLGQHRCWKNYFVDKVNPKYNQTILDLASGTGDIGFRIADKMAIDYSKANKKIHFKIGSEGRLILSDINAEMLKVAQDRSKNLKINGFEWLVADAAKIPLDKDTVDVVTISFGLRNCPEPEKVLAEVVRILKPGGRFMCLEFSKPSYSPISMLYNAYSFNVIPVMGAVVAADWDAYQYLVESIRMFYTKEKLCEAMTNSGFINVDFEELFFGNVCIHLGLKPNMVPSHQ